MKLISLKRVIVSSVISIALEFYSFNFVPRNINILATRSVYVQIFDYILNFVIFFLIIYLLISSVLYISNKLKK